MNESASKSQSIYPWRTAAIFTVIVWAACMWVRNGHPDPKDFGSVTCQFISRTVHTAFLIVCTVTLLAVSRNKTEPAALRWARIGLLAAFDGTLVEGFKHFAWMPRPHMSNDHGGHSGFPSGHTVPAFAVAFMISVVRPKLTIPAFAIASAIGFSRVRVHAHFTYQVVISAVLGCCIAWLVYRIVPVRGENVQTNAPVRLQSEA